MAKYKKYVDPPRPRERHVIFNNYRELGVVRITPRKWLVVSCVAKDGLKSLRIHLRVSIGNDPDRPDFIDKYKFGIALAVNGPDGFAEDNAKEKLLALVSEAVDYLDIMSYEDNIIYATDYDKPLAKGWYKDK